MSAGEFKDKGNAEFKVGNYDAAIGHFSSAIKLEPSHVLYSNRSACNCGLRKYDDALKDAESCIGLKGDWGKGYGRKGAALHGMGRFDDAVAAYEAGLKVEPGLAMLVKGLDDAKAQAQRGGGGGGGGGGMEDQLGTLFSRPDLLQKIAGNPQTAGFLADPTFIAKLEELKRDPQSINKHLQDQRILSVMGMLMGVNIQAPGAGGAEEPPPKKAEPKREPEVELTPEQKARAEKKKDADVHKDKGNAAYKAKSFEEAVGHYEKALEVLPDEMTYYNNLAAVRLEQKDYAGCIETCKKGIEVGRAVRADYKLVAKAFMRIGTAYKRQGMLPVRARPARPRGEFVRATPRPSPHARRARRRRRRSTRSRTR
jgi:stress-induced-phosphoprotein 1